MWRVPKRISAYGLVGLWCVLATVHGHAQTVQQMQTGFERDVNRYRWENTLQIVQQLAGWEVDLTNRFTSDAFLLFGNETTFRDENRLTWGLLRPVGDRVSARFRGHAAWFSQSDVFSQEIYGGLRITPRPSLWIEPVAGLAWDRRPGVPSADGSVPVLLDTGPAFGGRLGFQPQAFDGYEIQLEADGAWQVINPRRGRAVRVNGAAQRAFLDTRLRTRVQYANFRRDAYQAVSFLNRDEPVSRRSETVEATTNDTLFASIQLDTPLPRGLRLISQLDLQTNHRFIRTLQAPEDALFFDTDFTRRAVDFEAGFVYERSNVNARVAMQGGAEIEQRSLVNQSNLPPTQAAQKSNLLEQADYEQGFLSVSARLQAVLNRRMTLNMGGASTILRHDTPDTNPDDRDEVYHNGQIGLRINISRFVQADLNVFGTYYHTVYLNGARSAENNVLRSLRLRPTIHWTPSPRTRMRVSSQVRATYTVDDFVLPGRRPSDQSAREMQYDTEIRQSLGGRMQLVANGTFSDLRLGRFIDSRFAEIPFDTLRTYSGWVRLQTGQRVTAEVGMRLFIRSDYSRAVTVRYARVDEAGIILRDETGATLLTSITRPGREIIEQVGPTCAIAWPMRRNSTLRLDGWVNVQRVRHRLYGDLPEAAASRIKRAARRGTRKLIPNLALTMLWNF